jgi:uncharacterized protein YecE (DUF72 family)
MFAAPGIHVGTSGYSFADWVGPFYPPGTRSSAFLEYYATQFSCVEVNATYYRIPPPATLAGMAARTPEKFRFIVKLHQSFTHDPSFEAGAAPRFHEVLAPLKHAGKYHGLLAQFPWAFRRDERTQAHLERLREAFAGEPLWLEFRHDSWMHPGLPAWLAERDLGYCAVDEPALPHLVPPVTHVTNGIGYVRFHGRNARHWWGSGGRAAAAPGGGSPPARPGVPRPVGDREQLRYDYDYSERELVEWVARVTAMAQQARQTYLFFNNCHAGQAARNAKLMEELLRRSGALL